MPQLGRRPTHEGYPEKNEQDSASHNDRIEAW